MDAQSLYSLKVERAKEIFALIVRIVQNVDKLSMSSSLMIDSSSVCHRKVICLELTSLFL